MRFVSINNVKTQNSFVSRLRWLNFSMFTFLIFEISFFILSAVIFIWGGLKLLGLRHYNNISSLLHTRAWVYFLRSSCWNFVKGLAFHTVRVIFCFYNHIPFCFRLETSFLIKPFSISYCPFDRCGNNQKKKKKNMSFQWIDCDIKMSMRTA